MVTGFATAVVGTVTVRKSPLQGLPTAHPYGNVLQFCPHIADAVLMRPVATVFMMWRRVSEVKRMPAISKTIFRVQGAIRQTVPMVNKIPACLAPFGILGIVSHDAPQSHTPG